MRRLGLLLVLLLVPRLVSAAVAFDAVSCVVAGVAPADLAHTPVGTPRAVIVLGVVSNTATDQFTTAPAYGGVAMTEVAMSPVLKSNAEAGQVHAFFLGSGIPTGMQTVTKPTYQETSSFVKKWCVVTLTATADTDVVTSCIVSSDSVANPACTLSLGGRNAWAGFAAFSGDGSGSGTPFTNWTSRFSGTLNSNTSGEIHTYDIVGTTDVSAGYTFSADDAVLIAVAVSEVLGPPVGTLGLLGAGK